MDDPNSKPPLLSPPVKSFLTSILMQAAMYAAAWGTARGIVPNAEQNAVANELVSAALWAIGGLLTWYKVHQASPQAQITAVNQTDNGVRVIDASVPEYVAPTIVVPLK